MTAEEAEKPLARLTSTLLVSRVRNSPTNMEALRQAQVRLVEPSEADWARPIRFLNELMKQDTSRGDVAIEEVPEADVAGVPEGYALLREVMGDGEVEDIASFQDTVSSATDAAAVPKLVGAAHASRMVGFTVGAYLRNLNMGFIAYSAVRRAWRRCGVYTAMRHRLVDLFNEQASEDQGRSPYEGARHRVDYVISELDESGQAFRIYVTEWKAFALPCAYEQPAVQGLKPRELRLVLQPVAKQSPPGSNEILMIVRELYERVYRIDHVTENESFRRIASSLLGIPVPAAER